MVALSMSPGHEVRALSVIVPAKNEQEMLPGCLRALERACREALTLAPWLSVSIVVVLDSCTDASELMVRRHAEALALDEGIVMHVVPAQAGSVGAARALGADHAIAAARSCGVPARALWLASTDADTRVPQHWVSTQLSFAAAGSDAVVGTVEPDSALDLRTRARWFARHELVEGHPHVHGANFGVRASAYREAGGFAPLSAHEDVDLVTRLRAHQGIVVTATDRHRVVTSSRHVGRATGGFATYLTDIRGAAT